MTIEEPTVVLDERTTRSAPLPEGVLEHHLDQEAQKKNPGAQSEIRPRL